MTNPSIDDVLRAEFPGGYRRLGHEEGFRTYARDVQAKAFPSWIVDFDVVLLSSRRRECRQVRSEGAPIIIVDQGLTSLLALQDHLLRRQEETPDEELVVASLVFAEALYQNGLFDRACLCASKCLERREALVRLCEHVFRQPGHSGLGLFVLLHEMAHMAVDAAAPFTQQIVSGAKAALTTYRTEAGRLASGIALGQVHHDPRVTVETSDPALLASQILAHLSLTQADAEIVREACCDFLACVALLRMKTGYDALSPDFPTPSTKTLREIGDLLGLGMRGARLLMAKTALMQIVGNLARGSDPSLFDAPFSQMTARENIGAILLVDLFAAVARTRTDDRPFEEELKSESFVQLFHRDVEVVLARSNRRILEPVETLARYYADPSAYLPDLASVKARSFGNEPVSGLAWQTAFEAIVEQFPL